MAILESVTLLNGTTKKCMMNGHDMVLNTSNNTFYNVAFIDNHNVVVKDVRGEWFECEAKELLMLLER